MAAIASSGWRNSACVMMLSGPFRYCREPQATLGKKPFLEYTSELREQPEIVFVKRHSQSGFMANVHVFPGGVLDQADYSSSWMSVFSNHRQPFASILSLRDSGLPIFQAVPKDNSLAGEIALRICAIREFFEEAGILLARSSAEVDSITDFIPGSFPPSIANLPKPVLEEWRKRVHRDASQFTTMCRELECVPDIWSLIEMSNWLTPRNYTRRFDTIIYTCYPEIRPESTPDLEEVTDVRWIAPSQTDELFRANMLKFAPPQYTEIKKLETLIQLGGVPLVHLFTLLQSTKKSAISCKEASRMLVKDKTIVSVTELDDLCPCNPMDSTTPVQVPKSLELEKKGVRLTLSDNTSYEYEIPEHTADQLREMSTTFNRMEYTQRKFKFMDNVEVKAFVEFLEQINCSSKL